MKATWGRCVRAAFLMFICAAFLMCAACGRERPQTIDQISTLIEDSANFTNMSTLSDAQLSNYFDHSKEGVLQAKMVISDSESVADEYAVFELEDGNDGTEILAVISEHIANRQNSFRETSQTEYAKLQNSIIRQLDNFRILVVCENYVQVAKVLEENGAKAIK